MPKYIRPTSYRGRSATANKSGESKFATQEQASAGVADDVMISPAVLDEAVDALVADASTTVKGKIRIATDAEATTGTDKLTAMTPYTVGLIAIAGAPLASEILAGIAELATQVETDAGTDDARIVTPLKLKTNLASPPAIGGTAPNSGAFTDLAATGVGTGNVMTSDTASSFSVTGALADVTINSDAGRAIINGEEAADNAITLVSAAGGIDVDAALSIVISTSENTADALQLVASAGGIDVTAAGAAGEDIDIVCTGGSVNITAGESAADSIVISSSIGGIDITAAAAAAGEDIDITALGSSVNISSSESAADAITLSASAGGIDISAVGTAGEDIDITNTGASINVTATEDAAKAIYLHSNGGTSETIEIHADQGTGVASISLLSDVGGVTISGGVASADAVNIACGNAAGGVDIDSGTGGTILDSTGAISLDAAAASNFTVTGAGIDLTLESAAGRVIVNGEEAATDAITLLSAAGGIDVNAALEINIDSSEAAVADAVRIVASAADGGMDIDAGTGGIAIDTTGALSLQGAAASDFTVSGAGIDISIDATAGRVIVDGGEAAANAVTIDASDAAGGIDVDAGTGGVAVDSDGVISLDAAAASNFTVAGAGIDLTLDSAAGRVIVNGEEAAANAITLLSAAGGIDADAALEINIASSEAAATAISLTASNAAGGILATVGTGDFTIAGGDLKLTSAATQIHLEGGAVTDFIGQATLVAGTVTVANTNIAATDRIFVTRSALNGTPALGHLVTTIAAGASFTIAAYTNAGVAAITDVSTVDYFIVRQL